MRTGVAGSTTSAMESDNVLAAISSKLSAIAEAGPSPKPPIIGGYCQAITASIWLQVSSAWCTAQRSAALDESEPSTPTTIVPGVSFDCFIALTTSSVISSVALWLGTAQGRRALWPGPWSWRLRRSSAQPAQERIAWRGRGHAYPDVDCLCILRCRDDRVEVEVGQLGQIVRQPGDPQQDVRQALGVACRR